MSKTQGLLILFIQVYMDLVFLVTCRLLYTYTALCSEVWSTEYSSLEITSRLKIAIF